MNKLDMKSVDITDENIEKIGQLFPNVIIESDKGKSIDFDLLKQELSKDIVEGNKERYQLTWPGKKEAILTANTPTTKTLRPIREKSVDFDNTQNIYIEGDNLETLKILQESYLNKIPCIYIDPPYNTGNNLIYKNDFSVSEKQEFMNNGLLNDEGYKLSTNTKSNGRFHSDWISMMYPRIKLARNLLRNDGIIILAIDDNELCNLKKICDEIFGEESFVGIIVTRCNPQGRGKKNIDPCHEYHLIYSKNYADMDDLKIKLEEKNDNYKNFMRSGTNSRKFERPKRFYPMLLKDDKVQCISYEDYSKIYNEKSKSFNEDWINEITKKYSAMGYKVIWPIAQNGEEKVWQRVFERAENECDTYIYSGNQIKTPSGDDRTPMSLWIDDIYSNVSNGTNKLNALFEGKKVFDYSKSIFTVENLISLGNNDIVLDFFSGSATTAQAVMELNARDNKKRKFLMIQLPEKTNVESDAYKNGFETICDVGEERIRRAAKKIREETNADIDYGFRVFKIDSSNMNDIYYKPSDLKQSQINMFESNIKKDRTPEDLLTQVMLDLGLPLDLKIEEKQILDNKVYYVDDNSLVACFDDNVNINIVNEVAKIKPLRAVFKDSSFQNDSDKINLQERFKTLSTETEISIL